MLQNLVSECYCVGLSKHVCHTFIYQSKYELKYGDIRDRFTKLLIKSLQMCMERDSNSLQGVHSKNDYVGLIIY